ncbi:histidine phosphatase family protein [Actinacidiphila sp. DG2A-62]|jgi:probable phosphoglycerate mutase|uniref:histidine phosphatase family protein n=1 Tax=Actinacidiphila sp. DG2A-62 TaxID=3108821 RepID=UPI002DBFB39C|nr:histidine phosphatase family protein [Actinacidiphila sp. DG2A-62]MEC3998586.1 histidine phosphatase family protein [Actinacidiphila sp. DG2A-62]
MGELVLIRHGETEWTLSGQHTSYTDIPLTENGERQARTLAPLLASRHVACVLTSPMRRARDTAKLAGLDHARIDEDLVEWDYGGYEGVTTRAIHKHRPGWDLWTDGVVPGPDGHPGETPEEVGDRADRVLARVDAAFANGEGGDVVLVAHAHFLRVLTARRLGLPPADGALFQLATGTVSRLGLEHGRHVLTAWNRLP